MKPPIGLLAPAVKEGRIRSKALDRFSCDTVVIGAGVVGLAVARVLAQAGLDTVILEKNPHFGMETSARNSEVIHAGLYYAPGSLKARLCVDGRERLYDFCQSHGVGHRRTGKLIVAMDADQSETLAGIRKKAAANGVTDVRPLAHAEIAALEPELRVAEALFSPSTGIVDSHQYMLALLGDAESAGARLVLRAHVMGVTREQGQYRLRINNAGESTVLQARLVVNAAGLWAGKVAETIEGVADAPRMRFAKGSYAILTGANPFRHLVYPVPLKGGLGVHLTLDMGGQARFGPDVEWLETHDPAAIDYAVAPDIAARFATAVAAWWPRITPAMLAPGYSGVRPKASADPDADWRIEQPEGLPGLVNLFGMDSPGLTASLAIAEHVRDILRHA